MCRSTGNSHSSAQRNSCLGSAPDWAARLGFLRRPNRRPSHRPRASYQFSAPTPSCEANASTRAQRLRPRREHSALPDPLKPGEWGSYILLVGIPQWPQFLVLLGGRIPSLQLCNWIRTPRSRLSTATNRGTTRGPTR